MCLAAPSQAPTHICQVLKLDGMADICGPILIDIMYMVDVSSSICHGNRHNKFSKFGYLSCSLVVNNKLEPVIVGTHLISK